MNLHRIKKGCLALALIQTLGSLPAAAELRMLNEKAWLGYFTGFESNKIRWSFSTNGSSVLRVVDSKGNLASDKIAITFGFVVEETQPDGKVVNRNFIPESLESAQPPTTRPKGVIVRGKMSGDIAVELNIDEDGGKLSLGGRITDPGPTIKNPLTFKIRMKFPDAYPDDAPLGDKKAEKALEAKTKNDRLQFIRADKSRGKQSLTESVGTDATAMNGPGITNLEIESAGYRGRKFLLAATESSVMNFTIPKSGPLNGGFIISWNADLAKDPSGRARFVIDAR